MEKVTKGVNQSGWSAHFVTSQAPQIFIYAQCFDFISQNDCIACHTESRAELPRCFPAESGRIYLNGCYLLYNNYQFFEEALDRDRDMVKCGRPGVVSGDQYIGREFAKRVYKAVQNVTKTAGNMKFAPTGEKGGLDVVYAMAQCWKKLTLDSCQKCLSNAALKVSMCAPAPNGMVLNASCYLRYSMENFTRNGSGQLKAPAPGKNFPIRIPNTQKTKLCKFGFM